MARKDKIKKDIPNKLLNVGAKLLEKAQKAFEYKEPKNNSLLQGVEEIKKARQQKGAEETSENKTYEQIWKKGYSDLDSTDDFIKKLSEIRNLSSSPTGKIAKSRQRKEILGKQR